MFPRNTTNSEESVGAPSLPGTSFEAQLEAGARQKREESGGAMEFQDFSGLSGPLGEIDVKPSGSL